MLKVARSLSSIRKNIHHGNITLIYQFIHHPNNKKRVELQEVLKKNVENDEIDHIILLNERIYSIDELGIEHSKIEQINIGKKLTFYHIFEYIEKLEIDGYVVVCYPNIFFDSSLRNIKLTSAHEDKLVYSQLRFEYQGGKLGKAKIYGPRCDRQDAWMFHTNANVPEPFRSLFKYRFDLINFDLKLAYLFDIINFKIVNDPYFIKCYHLNNSDVPNFFMNKLAKRPIRVTIPYLNPDNNSSVFPLNSWTAQAGMQLSTYFNDDKNFYEKNDDAYLSSLIKYCDENNKSFSVCKLGVDNSNLTFLFKKFVDAVNNEESFESKQIVNYMQGSFQMLKNRGLELNNMKKLNLYVNKLLEVMQNSQVNIHLPIGHIEFLKTFNKSENRVVNGGVIFKFMLEYTRRFKRQPIGVNILNIGARLFYQNWFDLITNKRILIISKHHALIKKQIDKMEIEKFNYYKRPIFQKCSYIYCDVPVLSEENEDFVDVVNKYIDKVKPLINNFDIAFIGDSEYDFFVLDFLYKNNKSGICVGKFLPLWFGLYSREDMENNKDVVKLNLNKHWNMLQ
jgi:hypothetical protein